MLSFSGKNKDATSFFCALFVLVVVLYLLIVQLPVLLVAAGLAYLFNPLLIMMSDYKVNRLVSLVLILLLLLAVSSFVLFCFVPFAVLQITSLLHVLPDMVVALKSAINNLPHQFPEYIDLKQINTLSISLQSWFSTYSSSRLSVLFALIPSAVSLLAYLFLVPVLVFLFLKDGVAIKRWCCSLLPKDSKLFLQFFNDIDMQLGNYIRGKIAEIVIVIIVSWVVFWLLGLKYSFVLALVFGFSVLIPVIGAVFVTVPVAIVAYWQWGGGDWFWLTLLVHGVLLLVDGNFLVPWIFADRLNLHPSVVILAVIYFGNLFGFWGVFFAIPLAGVMSLLLNLWRFRN